MKFERGKTIKEARGHRQGQGHRHAHHLSSPTPRSSARLPSSRPTPIAQRLRELAFLNSGLEIVSPTSALDPEDRGLPLQERCRRVREADHTGKTALHPVPVRITKELKTTLDDKPMEIHVEIVLQYNDTYKTSSSATPTRSTIRTAARTSPVFRSALTRATQPVFQGQQSAQGQGSADHG